MSKGFKIKRRPNRLKDGLVRLYNTDITFSRLSFIKTSYKGIKNILFKNRLKKIAEKYDF